MIRLFVTEKRSVARDLGRVLGARRRESGYLAGDGVWVAWCLGHLVEICEPHEHEARWKRWDPAQLPILPERLKLRPIRRNAGHYRTLAGLLRRKEVGEVVNACDAGREGEHIFRTIYEHSGCRKPVRRLWLSSLTAEAIRRALGNLRPGSAYDPLAAAARCRAEADWLVGMNGTRGLTAVGGTLLSVGRVQTPTLAMVVEREEAIERFVPQPYWEVHTQLEAAAGNWEARWLDPRGKGEEAYRLKSAEQAEAVAEALRGQPGQVAELTRKEQRIPPPQLHHLTSLQQLANRRFGFSAQRTLELAQSLYERRKLITYPRTDSRHLSRDVAATLPEVLRAVATGPYAPFAQEALAAGPPRLSRRFVDDAQVSDHHALIPTAKTPPLDGLDRDERRVYDLIARRFLAAFFPPARYAKSRIDADVAGHCLRAEGRVRLEPGWERVEPPAPTRGRGRGGQAPERELPAVERDDPLRCREAKPEAKETRPPKRYTEATLLGAMERAGRTLEEAELRRAMRDVGLGTPATRAATLETLIRRQYLTRQGKQLAPTPTGRALMRALPVAALKSPRLTGEWEARLAAIAAGSADPAAFRAGIRSFTAEVVDALRAAPRIAVEAPPGAQGKGRGRGSRSRRRTGGRSGGRGRGRGNRGRSGGRRNARDGATRTRGRKSAASRPEARRESGRTSDTKRAVAGGAHGGRATAGTQATGAKTSAARRGPRCRACGSGRIIRGNRGWGCDRWREGCRFVVWFVQDGVSVPEDEAERLFRRGQTRLFATSPASGRKARLVLDLEAPGNTRWEETRRGRAGGA